MRAILTYHSIDPSGSPISIDVRAFERHVAWFASGAVRVLSLSDLLCADEGNAVALTFDDGFTNFATEAWPRLSEHGLPATLYVVNDHVGGTNAWEPEGGPAPIQPLCDWETLGRLAEEGVELGVHGNRHVSLVGLEAQALADETGGALARLKAETGREATSFAYPFGDHDTASVRAVSAMFENACTTRMRFLADVPSSRHRLPRLDAFYFAQPGRLEGWGSGRFRRYVAMRALAREARLFGRRLLRRDRPI